MDAETQAAIAQLKSQVADLQAQAARAVQTASQHGLGHIDGSDPTWNEQAANTFLGAPNGSTGGATFRTLAAADVPASLLATEIPFIIDGGGSAITTGEKGHLVVPFNCTVTGWTILADQSGSIVVAVAKDTYANFPPTFTTDEISGTEKPTLSTAQKNQDLSLSSWTTTLTAGDILAYKVDSITTVTRVVVSLKVTRT